VEARVPPLTKGAVLEEARCLTSMYREWKREARDRKPRAMGLSEEVVEKTLEFAAHYPHLGGRKGIATLENREEATMNRQQYDAVKKTLREEVWAAVKERSQGGEQKAGFHLPPAKGLNDVWASDILTLELYGLSFDVAFTLDVWNTEALGYRLRFGTATAVDTRGALEDAHAKRGALPGLYAKSDNGSQYKALVVREGLEAFAQVMRFTPRGCPWWNGEAEGFVRELKALLLARANERPEPKDKAAIEESIRDLVAHAFEEFNTQIARPKNEGLTPAQAASPNREEEVKRVKAYRKRARAQAAQERTSGVTLETLKAQARAFVDEHVPLGGLKQLGSLLLGRYRGAKVCV